MLQDLLGYLTGEMQKLQGRNFRCKKRIERYESVYLAVVKGFN